MVKEVVFCDCCKKEISESNRIIDVKMNMASRIKEGTPIDCQFNFCINCFINKLGPALGIQDINAILEWLGIEDTKALSGLKF